ncbi:MAG: hypothetical protein MZV65_48705 [Chromatiales bacterium]|nr:hypothetical protein [Chromatiales bacterium]
MQPRVKAFVAKLDDLIARLEQHIRMKLAEAVDFSRHRRGDPRGRGAPAATT